MKEKKSPFAALHSQLHLQLFAQQINVQGVVYDPSEKRFGC